MTTLSRFTYYACILQTAFCMCACAQTTAFSYQGQLTDNGSPANGLYDLRFELYDAHTLGSSLGVVTNAATAITNGLFTVTLDFGSGVFDGSERWLEVGAVTNGGGAFSTLSPRQPITSTPYAVRAANSASAEAVSGTVDASQLTGTISSNNIGSATITSVMLANGAVGTTQLADDAVTAEKIITTSDWFLTSSLIPPAPEDDDVFGFSAAGVGADTFLIGASGDNTGAEFAGAVYLFSTDGTLLTTFTNPVPEGGGNFGNSVAGVGTAMVLIGVQREDIGANQAGAAYLFSTNGTLTTTFTNPTPAASDRFGNSVAGVGADKVLIAAYQDNTGAIKAGAAYLFSTNGTLLTTYTNPTPELGDEFGRSVAGVGADTVLIGAPRDDTGSPDAGAAYLFSTDGTLLTTITNPAPGGDDYFGRAVSGVGSDKVLIGAYLDDTGASDAGAAYLFSTDGTLLTTFTNPTPEINDQFGYAVAGVGTDTMLIGAQQSFKQGGTDTDSAGVAYLFRTNGTLLTTFTNPTPKINDRFGSAVAGLGAETILIGAYEDDTGANDAGAAYLFELRDYTPGLVAGAVLPDSITSLELSAGAVAASDIGGVLFPTQIPDLDASKVTSGIFDPDRVPALDASKITTGTLAGGRLAGTYSSALTLGNPANNFSGTYTGDSADNASAPSFAWSGDGDTGLFRPGTDTVALTTGGTERMRIASSGQVGIGTSAPEGDVHIRGNSTTGSLLITPNISNSRSQILLTENTTASLGMIIRYAGDEADNPLHVIGWTSDVESAPLLTIERFGGNVGIGIDDPTERLHVVGNILATGTITPSSDHNLKKNFDSVDAQEVLERVTSLPIQQWTYKAEEDSVRHVGPMAQDFHAAFGLGANDTTIATVDADGVALAAIQGLNEKLEALERTVQHRDAENAELKWRIEKLERLLNTQLRAGEE